MKLIKSIESEFLDRGLFSPEPDTETLFVNEDGQWFSFFCKDQKKCFLVRYAQADNSPEECSLLESEARIYEYLVTKKKPSQQEDEIKYVLKLEAFVKTTTFIALVYHDFIQQGKV